MSNASKITRRAVLAKSAKAAVGTAIVAASAIVAGQASATGNTDTIDNQLIGLWEERARILRLSHSGSDNDSDGVISELLDVCDKIYAVLAKLPPRTPTVSAIEAVLTLIDNSDLFDAIECSVYGLAVLLPRLTHARDQITGRLADDVAELVNNPSRWFGICRVCTGGGEPPDLNGGNTFHSNPLMRIESGFVMMLKELAEAYPNAKIGNERVPREIFLPTHPARSIGLHTQSIVQIVDDTDQFASDLKDWKDYRARTYGAVPSVPLVGSVNE